VLIAGGMAWVWLAGYNVILQSTTHFGKFDLLVNTDVGAIQVAGRQMDTSNTLRLELIKRFDAQAFFVAEYETTERVLHSQAGFSESRLLAQPELLRRRVDTDLLWFERVTPGPADGAQPTGSGLTVEKAGGGTAAASSPCTVFRPISPTANALELTVPAGSAVIVQPHSGTVALSLRRFAQSFSHALPASSSASAVPLAALVVPAASLLPASSAPVLIPFRADTSAIPWHMRVSSTGRIELCTAASSPTPRTQTPVTARAPTTASTALAPTTTTATPVASHRTPKTAH
jgi:hypothetical protein